MKRGAIWEREKTPHVK